MLFSKCLRAKIYCNMNGHFDPQGCQTLLLKESELFFYLWAPGLVIFFLILKMVYCVYSLESPRCGDSIKNTLHTFILKKIDNNIHVPIMPPDFAL